MNVDNFITSVELDLALLPDVLSFDETVDFEVTSVEKGLSFLGAERNSDSLRILI